MITAKKLYGKTEITKGQRLKVEVANETAQDIFNNKRHLEPWVKDLPENATLADVENILIEALRSDT